MFTETESRPCRFGHPMGDEDNKYTVSLEASSRFSFSSSRAGSERKTAQTRLPGLEIVWPCLPTACAAGYFQTSASRTRFLRCSYLTDGLGEGELVRPARSAGRAQHVVPLRPSRRTVPGRQLHPQRRYRNTLWVGISSSLGSWTVISLSGVHPWKVKSWDMIRAPGLTCSSRNGWILSLEAGKR